MPERVIVEVAGPLRVTDGTVTVDGSWDLLQASINASQTGLQRLSLAANGSVNRLASWPWLRNLMSEQALFLLSRPPDAVARTPARPRPVPVARARRPASDAA